MTPVAVAHQYRIRAAHALADPRPPLDSLKGCTVEAITVHDARPLILKYEWLRSINSAPMACYGLRSPVGELLGAVSFGKVGSPEAHDLCGRDFRDRTIALERGCCVHWAPMNAASFLISRACKAAHREHGWSVFFAYADSDAGEIGTVYHAAGWQYLGRGVGHRQGYREEWRRAGGTAWHDEKLLRQHGLKKAEALSLGWEHRRRATKHRYAWFADPTMALRCRYPFLAYPKARGSIQFADQRSRGVTMATKQQPLDAFETNGTSPPW
jgi:hypothetical protein